MDKQHYLTQREEEMVTNLKSNGVLKSYTKDDWRGVATNGGVAIVCSDGDIDAYQHHAKVVSPRPHCLKVFGGPLLLAPSFPEFEQHINDFLMKQIGLGMSIKETGTIFVMFHHPCGMAMKHGYNLKDILECAWGAHRNLINSRLRPKKVFTFLHVKKAGRQSTYLLDLFKPFSI